MLDSASIYDIAAEKTNFRMVYGQPVATEDIAESTTLQRDLLLEPIELNKEVRMSSLSAIRFEPSSR
jgi:hypothetical protein